MALRAGRVRLDHLQLYAPSIEAGLAHLRDTLDVELDLPHMPVPTGDADPVHCLGLSLGGGSRLDIVTPAEARSRGLDPGHFAARLATGAFLGHWTLRLERPALLPQLADDYPRRLDPVGTGRLGSGECLLGRRADGAWPRWRGAGDGIVPTVVQQRSGTPPVAHACGLTLRALRGAHPAVEVINEQLRWLGADAVITVEATLLDPELSADIETPHGLRTLR
ncbi:hypothetical protein [Chitinasiproducens palmae]|uniref:Glyoxalase-like domain-containing protein n=1 Tax=Chitinasiproducens palmae TaxID=1770053 RepID=A0A1H2PUN7_9BURK|nr:hypothetical protein [Chitinasiproducens palmae]SDV50930.1 hypothetical protein SAMN05216551_11436 [Chitinasiproducens palmae]